MNRIKDLALDLILCPVFPFPAIGVDDMSKVPPGAVAYSLIWTFMDFPAGIVKGGMESGQNLLLNGNGDETQMEIARMCQKLMAGSTGMPIGVQILGKSFQEESVLRVMVELEEILNL